MNNMVDDVSKIVNKLSSMVFSVAVGLVTDNQDPEKRGRVKIKYPWRPEIEQTDWIRVASFMTGKDRGGYFIPEIDDEVLVGFDRGDINSPFVIASLWNGVDKPPETNADGKNNIRKITSRIGHEIIFDDDKNGKAYLEIKTKAGHTIKLNDESNKEMISIMSKSGHSIVLDDTSGSEKIDIKDKSGSILNFDSTQQSIKMSSQNITIEGTNQLKLKANMIQIEGTKIDIKSNAILTLKGAMIKLN